MPANQELLFRRDAFLGLMGCGWRVLRGLAVVFRGAHCRASHLFPESVSLVQGHLTSNCQGQVGLGSKRYSAQAVCYNQSNLGRKRCIWRTFPHHFSSLEEVRTGTGARKEPGGRSWCRDHGGMLLPDLLTWLCWTFPFLLPSLPSFLHFYFNLKFLFTHFTSHSLPPPSHPLPKFSPSPLPLSSELVSPPPPWVSPNPGTSTLCGARCILPTDARQESATRRTHPEDRQQFLG